MAGWMLYVHALTPIHSGTGAAAGVVDLPVARERTTTWPYLPGSSLKGVLRDAAEFNAAAQEDQAKRQEAEQTNRLIFGPDTDHADEGAGAVWFADAHLLCLPVRSFRGTFAWVTCRLALERWRRDLVALGANMEVTLPAVPPDGSVRLGKRGTIDYEDEERDEHNRPRRDAQNQPIKVTRIALEDLDFAVEPPVAGDAATLAVATVIADALFPATDWWRDHFVDRLALIDDDTFGQLARTATEVVARIRLDPASKTVATGALWYEEAVPAEAIFTAPIGVAPRQRDEAPRIETALTALAAAPGLQIGGHAGVGRGLVRLRLI